MNGPFWIGQAVVVLDHPLVRKRHPEVIGRVFTIASGLEPHDRNPRRLGYSMQEPHLDPGHCWFFAPDEIRPLRDPSEDLANPQEEALTT